MRTYNYLDDQDVISCRRLETIVLGNKYIKQLPKTDILRGLLIKALNEGAFSRYSNTKEEALYWLPSSNAGVPIVPRDSYLHETKFMIHDILHQLTPDIIIDTFDTAYKDIYVLSRMISETITMALADYIYLRRFAELNIFDDNEYEELKNKKIYKTLENEYDGFFNGHYHILYNHTLFGITGKYVYRNTMIDQELYERFIKWANNVYAGDFKWTCDNYNKILANGQGYLEWAEYAKEVSSTCGSDYWFLSDFKNIINYSYSEKLDYLFEKMYKKMYDGLEDQIGDYELIKLEEREKFAKNKIEMYNALDNFIVNPSLDIVIAKNKFNVNKITRHYKAGTVSYYPKENKTIRTVTMNYQHIKPKIILEGTDGVGKTSIKKILEDHGFEVSDREKRISNLMFHHIDQNERNIVLRNIAVDTYNLIVCLTISDKNILNDRIMKRKGQHNITYFDKYAWDYQQLYEDSFNTIATFENVLVLDRTNLTLEQTAKEIIDYYNKYTT